MKIDETIQHVIFRCENISKSFGELKALSNVSFQVFDQEIYGIAGPNGAGKTTLFNVITKSGIKADSGQMKFAGTDITNMPTHVICKLGINRTYQTPAIFPNLSVMESLKAAGYFGGRVTYSNDELVDLLDFVGLKEKKDKTAKELSLFDQKLLMIALAKATKGKLLLLDEPLGGLSIEEVEYTRDLIQKIHDQKVTIIVIEHIIDFVVNICDRLLILNQGQKLVEGKPKSVVNDAEVIKAYLGPKYKT